VVKQLLRDSNRVIFRLAVTYFWLLHWYTIDGQPLKDIAFVARQRGVMHNHLAFSVGFVPKHILYSPGFTCVANFLTDFFPEFYTKNPFTEPEYYEYPYEHVTLDMMVLIETVPWRRQMLQIAEERKYTFGEFYNWCANQLYSYNDKAGEMIFSIKKNKSYEPFINYLSLKNESET